MKYAQDYLREHNRPLVLPISLVRDGQEPAGFSKSFK